MMYYNTEEIEYLANNIGANKVLGCIEENVKFVQGKNNGTDNNETMELTDDCYPCPYYIFKSFKRQHDNKENKENVKDNKEKRIKNDDNILMRTFLRHIDPLCELCIEAENNNLHKFKMLSSILLDNDKYYYKKLGFSRKKNATPLSTMKKEIESPNTDNIMSKDTLSYICKIANVKLIVITDKNEKIEIENLKESEKPEETKNSTYFIVEENDHTHIKKCVHDKEVEQYMLSVYNQKNNTTISHIENMSFHDIRHIYRFIVLEKNQKLKKKDEIINYIKNLI